MDSEPRAVAVGVLKGGHGKSTTAVNLGRELAHRHDSALIVDLDDNGHLTNGMGFQDAFTADVNHTKRIYKDGDDPRDYIVSITDGLDLLPSHDAIEETEDALGSVTMGTTRVKQSVVDELLGDDYDYIIIDCPAARGKLNDNAMFATRNLIIPLRPETGYDSGLTNTVSRLVMDARDAGIDDMSVLSVVPTDLRRRIDQNTEDRRLLDQIHAREHVRERVPNFAHFSDDEWEAIDAGDYDGPLPGIRHRDTIAKTLTGTPVRDADESCDQLHCYEELAAIVENGEVTR
jgi:chromosome partitioning protein